jgi:hypothetical protein
LGFNHALLRWLRSRRQICLQSCPVELRSAWKRRCLRSRLPWVPLSWLFSRPFRRLFD